jgi:PTH1 family peptidyl-tRNA hydrolase
MHLIVGLGNPGPEYARTRHNAGWFVLDELARRHNIEFSRKSNDARIGTGLIGDQRVLLAKPLTYMNLSGRAVAGLMRYHNIERERIIIICDDLNLPLGKLRLRPTGSDGGHNGLKSVAQALGSKDYARLRFGVGEPPREERQERGTRDFVLKAFASDEWPLVDEAVSRAADCGETFVRESVEAAMNLFN